jgi:peroxiredoxin
MIRPGDRFPAATLYESTAFGDACPLAPTPVDVTQALAGKRVVVFGLPGAFTSTCSAKHLPGYVENFEALAGRGIDEVWCVSVNDGYVMAAWGREHGAIGKLRMLGDGDGELTRKLGLEVQLAGMGLRMRRSSMLVDDGVLVRLNLEEPRQFAVSSAQTMLSQLDEG